MPDATPSDRLVRHEAVLLVALTLVAVTAFIFTRAVAARVHAVNRSDAAVWFHIGEQQLAGGQATGAVASLRRATARDRNNRRYLLTLSRALASSGQADAARRTLLGLRDAAPDDPDVNIELARLAAGRADVAEARRFFNNALYGVWPAARAEERTRLRVELIQFLLTHGERATALSETMALVANLPPTVPFLVEAGRLFLAAGDLSRALDQFSRALRLEPHNDEALAGAGETAFALANYAGALRYLGEARGALPDALAELREVSRLILAGDPLAPRLTLTARRERLAAAVTRATARLDECRAAHPEAAGTLGPLATDLAALVPRLQLRSLRDEPQIVDHGVDLVYRAERTAADVCGPPRGLDRALLLIGERHQAAVS